MGNCVSWFKRAPKETGTSTGSRRTAVPAAAPSRGLAFRGNERDALLKKQPVGSTVAADESGSGAAAAATRSDVFYVAGPIK